MGMMRAWRYRLYPLKLQQQQLDGHLRECKDLWNSLLESTKEYHHETGRFLSRKELYLLTKDTGLHSQVAQNVADRLSKSLKCVMSRKKAGRKAGFPRFKSAERIRSFTYPQFGFKLGEKLHLSRLGPIAIKKHRDLEGTIKTLTIKKSPSGRWYTIFTSEVEVKPPKRKAQREVGIDLGVEHFAHLSDDTTIENPRHLKKAEDGLKKRHKALSNKQKGSSNRRKARLRLGHAFEKLTDARKDFLHKLSRKLVD